MANRYPVTPNPEHNLETCQNGKDFETSDVTPIKEQTKHTEQNCVPKTLPVIDESVTKERHNDRKRPPQKSPTVAINLQEATQKLFAPEVEASSEAEKGALKRLEQAIKILGRGAVRAAQKQKAARKQPKTTEPKISDYRISAETGIDGKNKVEEKQPLNSLQISHSATPPIPQVP